ncbi:MAG: CDGSH iron-sulfur domain-containing protein [Magnetococcales bacterium]|nr:CDGSH iron-sulfur domain-containing protein [Magnetococcales bacterium]
MSGPKMVKLPAGEHWLCLCGTSKNGHLCDGSHKNGTNKTPKKVTLKQAGEVAVCQCGHTGNSPHCDGSHKKLPS